VAYGARLEIVLGVTALAGSNPASSATYQHKRLASTNTGAERSQLHEVMRSVLRHLYLSDRHEHARRSVVGLVVIVCWLGPHEPADMVGDGCASSVPMVTFSQTSPRVSWPEPLYEYGCGLPSSLPRASSRRHRMAAEQFRESQGLHRLDHRTFRFQAAQ
jgi:hypothetical protein